MRSVRLLALVVLALSACPAVAAANPLGDLFRVSELPLDDGRGSAFDPQVEYNAGTSEYLVSWTADSVFSPGEDEIWVQRLTQSGAQLGADRRISTIGPEGDRTREPFGRPSIAADPINRRNLVVWSSDEANDEFGDSEFAIYGQLLDADGEEIGADDFEVSGLQHGALYPDVAFNPGTAAVGDEEYLVTWTGEARRDPVQWGQRLDEDGTPIGARLEISQFAESGRGSLPQVAYNAREGEYLVAWYGFKADEDGEVWGQRLRTNGTEIGDDLRLTTTGTDTDEITAGFPSIAYNPFAGNYLMTWSRDERVENPNPPPVNTPVIEVFSQVLSDAAVPQGAPVRLSAVGPIAYESVVAYASSPGAGQYLVMWQQESPPPGIFDYDMVGRRVSADGTPLADAFTLFASDETLNLSPWVAARTDALEWLSVWSSDCPGGPGIPAQDTEIFGRRVDAGPAPTGDGTCRLPAAPTPGPDPTPQPTPVGNPPAPTPAPAQPAGPQPAPTAPPRLRAEDVLKLPSTRRCVSRRRFRIRLRTPRGTRIVRATVKVNGKRVRTVRGRRITAPVDLRGLPKGRFRVAIEVRTADGRKVTETRRYRTCVPRRRH